MRIRRLDAVCCFLLFAALLAFIAFIYAMSSHHLLLRDVSVISIVLLCIPSFFCCLIALKRSPRTSPEAIKSLSRKTLYGLLFVNFMLIAQFWSALIVATLNLSRPGTYAPIEELEGQEGFGGESGAESPEIQDD
jgi:hypothetical protein